MRTPITTDVDGVLLADARRSTGLCDAALFDAGLRALIVAAEDRALTEQPYTLDFGSSYGSVPSGVVLDDYTGRPPADVVARFRLLGLC